jgi:hypothetical protein
MAASVGPPTPPAPRPKGPAFSLNVSWATAHLRLLAILIPFLLIAAVWLSLHANDRRRAVAVATRSDFNSTAANDAKVRSQKPEATSPGETANPSNGVALPAATAQELKALNPRKLMQITSLGVAKLGSAKNRPDKLAGASLLQSAALLGYMPARTLLVGNYPKLDIVRTAVPAFDVVRYAVDLFTSDPTGNQSLLLQTAGYFSAHGNLAGFFKLLMGALRVDERYQTPAQIEPLFAVLLTVPGACNAVHELILSAAVENNCAQLTPDAVLSYVAVQTPAVMQENDDRSRAAALLRKAGVAF